MATPPSDIEQVVYDSPLAVDPETLRLRGFQTAEIFRRYGQYVPDLREHIVGPMPPDQFLDQFLPASSEVDSGGRLSSRYAFHKVPPSANTPAEIYHPLVRMVSYCNEHIEF